MKKLILLLILMACSLFLQAQTSEKPEGSGTITSPYQISNIKNLYWMSQDTSLLSKYFIQTADIDASETNTWNVKNDTVLGFTPLGYYNTATDLCYFTGHYNGKGHSISGLYIYRVNSNLVGFIGYAKGAIIDSLNLINLKITGLMHVGALIGSANGNVKVNGCSSSGSVKVSNTNGYYCGGLIGSDYKSIITNCQSSATVSGYNGIGGLIGEARYDSIASCSTVGNVSGSEVIGGLVGLSTDQTSISNSYSRSRVYGTNFVGGLVGSSVGVISDSYTTGNVLGAAGGSELGCFAGLASGRITNCYSLGNMSIPSGGRTLGGFVGSFQSGAILGCYSTGNITSLHKTLVTGGFAGGLANCTVDNCFSTGSVSAYYTTAGFVGSVSTANIKNCYTTGSVYADSTSSRYFGGFAGYIITSSATSNCYTVSPVKNKTGASILGGFLGYNSTSTYTGCYWNSEISGKSIGISSDDNKQSVTGYNTAKMKNQSNFSAWAFDTVWAIRNDSTYPALRKVSNNAPFAFADTIKGASIKLNNLLNNDFDYETIQTKLTYKTISCTNKYGINTANTFTFNSGLNEGATDTIVYRVGEIISEQDTLWGNCATSLLVYKADVPTQIVNGISSKNISIYPNPATNAFTVNGLDGTATVAIADINGKQMLNECVNEGNAVNINSLPAGAYVVKISTANVVVKKKLIKK